MPCTRTVIRCSILLLLPLAACDTAGGERSSGFAVRDSAGIQIAESTAPAWRDGQGWNLSAAPTLDIGVVEGAPEYQLTRVTGALRLANGGIAVANGASQEIRFYDAAGKYLRAVGGQGGGPGEFRGLGAIQLLRGDSIFAFDIMQQRLSVFSPEGDFVRSAQLERAPGGGLPFASGALRDGSVVVHVLGSEGGATEGLERRSETFLHYSRDGKMLDTISVQPGSERFVQTQSGSGGMMRMSLTTPLFGHTQVESVNGDRAVLGGNESYELAVYTPDGVLERLIRRRGAPRPVTDDALESLLKTRLDAVSDPARRQTMERSYREIPHPSTMPSYEAVLLDDGGNLWVREFQPPPAASPAWTVFDPDGRMLGAVSLPDRFKPTQIGIDFVLGVWSDDLDVQHVRMYRLEKPV
jgi:hypothetical protein